MEKSQTRRVAVLVETSNAYGREIQLGIADYVRDHARLSVFVEQHEYLSYLFKKTFGQSPGRFRRLRTRKGNHTQKSLKQ